MEVIDLDDDDEKAQEETKGISLLKVELEKWKYRAGLCEEGMIPLPLHMNTVKEIREKRA